MSRTNYEAVADFAGHWLHRAQVSLLTGSNRVSNRVSHIVAALLPKKTLVRAWCGPGAGSNTEAAEPASLQDRSSEKNPGAGLVRAWCGPGAGKIQEHIERSKIIFRTTYQNIKYRFIIQFLNKVNTLFIFINLI